MNYSILSQFSSEYVENANVISNVLRLSNSEKVLRAKKTGPVKQSMLRPELEPMELMQSIPQ